MPNLKDLNKLWSDLRLTLSSFENNALTICILECETPRKELANSRLRIQESANRLGVAVRTNLSTIRMRVEHVDRLLKGLDPGRTIRMLGTTVGDRSKQLSQLMQVTLDRLRLQLSSTAKNLQAVSPLSVMDRGFAVVSKPDETEFGKVIRSTKDVKVGETVQAHIRDGTLETKVTSVVDKNRH